jgi:hypothetical protein
LRRDRRRAGIPGPVPPGSSSRTRRRRPLRHPAGSSRGRPRTSRVRGASPRRRPVRQCGSGLDIRRQAARREHLQRDAVVAQLDEVAHDGVARPARAHDRANDGTDGAFRQTGWQRNNGNLGGVTSFRYYGEVVDPELSNLGISTLGIGTRLGRDASIDLVWHEYRQDVAEGFLRQSDLDEDPDGVHRDLGREIDWIAGLRNALGSDFELVLGWFEPGDAFPDADAAWKVSLQWRYRF